MFLLTSVLQKTRDCRTAVVQTLVQHGTRRGCTGAGKGLEPLLCLTGVDLVLISRAAPESPGPDPRRGQEHSGAEALKPESGAEEPEEEETRSKDRSPALPIVTLTGRGLCPRQPRDCQKRKTQLYAACAGNTLEPEAKVG